MDGSFFRFIAHSAQSGVEHLKKHLGSQILDRVDVGMRTEFIDSLVYLSYELNLNNPRAEGHRSQVQSSIETVLQLAFPDSQSDVYKMVFDTMQDGGLQVQHVQQIVGVRKYYEIIHQFYRSP